MSEQWQEAIANAYKGIGQSDLVLLAKEYVEASKMIHWEDLSLIEQQLAREYKNELWLRLIAKAKDLTT